RLDHGDATLDRFPGCLSSTGRVSPERSGDERADREPGGAPVVRRHPTPQLEQWAREDRLRVRCFEDALDRGRPALESARRLIGAGGDQADDSSPAYGNDHASARGDSVAPGELVGD